MLPLFQLETDIIVQIYSLTGCFSQLFTFSLLLNKRLKGSLSMLKSVTLYLLFSAVCLCVRETVEDAVFLAR